MQLSDEQQRAFELVQQVLRGSIRQCLIQGSPGTGKTFSTANALRESGLPLDRLAVACPTHKSKIVVQDYLSGIGIDLDCYTIHSLLGIAASIDEGTGKQEFKNGRSKVLPIDNYDFIWADECSMYSSELFNQLIGKPARFIFTGDKRQLRPVGEATFACFDFFAGKPEEACELTIPQRYSGAIKELVYNAIPHIDNSTHYDYSHLILDEHCHSVGDWVAEWKSSEEETVVLAYTNKAVNRANALLKMYCSGYPLDEHYIGEELIAYAPIKGAANKIMIPNGTIVKVADASPSRIVQENEVFTGYELCLEHYLSPVFTLDRESQIKWDKYLEDCAKDCKAKKRRWSSYYYIKGRVADLRPTYALTIHKSQGSGYQRVILCDAFHGVKDFGEQARLLYVGASRAKKDLRLCPFI